MAVFCSDPTPFRFFFKNNILTVKDAERVAEGGWVVRGGGYRSGCTVSEKCGKCQPGDTGQLEIHEPALAARSGSVAGSAAALTAISPLPQGPAGGVAAVPAAGLQPGLALQPVLC